MKSRPSKKEETVREMGGWGEAKGEYSSVFEQGMTDSVDWIMLFLF